MNPQDKVERVLKEIHVTFAKSPTYNNQPDKMIIDRKHFLGLLDRLNNGIYDMMEQYEQTRQSRQNAERAFKRKGDEIIETANASADDIYAASVIYTSDAIGRIRDLMDQTNDSMNDLFRQFRRELKEQKDMLKSHESELEAQLADLADTKKYLMLLEEMKRQHDRQNRDLAAEREAGNQYAKSMFYTAPTQADVKVNEAYFDKSGKPTPEEREAKAVAPVEKPDIQVNQNAAYFKWKAEQDAKKAREKTDVPDSGNAPDTAVTENRAESPAPEFPDEEAILQAVLEDERQALEELAKAERDSGTKKRSVLKNIFFGDD